MEFSMGKIQQPQRIGIYGPEGVGKSTLASRLEKPLFIDLEDGTRQMDVQRVSGFTTWEEVIFFLKHIQQDPTVFLNNARTLVIDTVDRAEQMAVAYICRKYRQDGLESFGYGRGYTYLAEAWNELLSELDGIIAVGFDVVLIAHARQRKVERPAMGGSYDHWEMKLTKLVGPLCKEWLDMLLFLNYKPPAEVIMEHRRQKNTSYSSDVSFGRRDIYANHTEMADAKNRHNLPDEMTLNERTMKRIFNMNDEEEKSNG